MPNMATSTRLLLLVILLSSRLSATAATYQYSSPRVTFGLLSLYTFTEGAVASTATSSADQSDYSKPVFGNLTNINVDAQSSSWTTGRPGLHLNGTGTQNRAISVRNTSTLVSLLSSTAAFTFELWFTPANASQYGIIAGLGSWAAKSQEPGSCRSGGVTYDDIAIAQKGTQVTVNFLGGSAASPSCISSTAITLVGPTPYHFIVTISATTVTTYFNNTVAPVGQANINMSNWVSSMSLMFGQTLSPAPVTYNTVSWAGDVFLAAIYNRTLSNSEMLQNHAAGIPHSVPLPYPSTLWIVVDVTATFTAVPVLSYNNTDSSTFAPITLYILAAPSFGSLYTVDANGPVFRVGDPTHLTPFAFTSSTAFAYIPGGTSGYTDSFQYYVGNIDTHTQLITALLVSAISFLHMCSLILFKANNSFFAGPTGLVNLLVVAPATPAGAQSPMSLLALANLTLTLTSADTNGFAIAGALSVWITQLPSYGALYQTTDGVTLGTPITTVPWSVANSNFSVIYMNTAATAPYGGLSVLYTDTIRWQPRLTYNGTIIKSAMSNLPITQQHLPINYLRIIAKFAYQVLVSGPFCQTRSISQ